MDTWTAARRRSGRPPAGELAALVAVLLVWNLAINLVLPRAWYVPANLALTVGVFAVAWRWGLSARLLGLERRQLRRGALVGGGALVVVGAAVALGWALPATRPLLADERAAGLSAHGLAFEALLRIPLGTAVAEEAAFRSVLLGAIAARAGWRAATLWSSVVFGLWHIGPTLVLVEANELTTEPLAVAGLVAAGCVLTFVAGLGFCLLRWWGRHVIAPVLAHVATNVFSLLAAVGVHGLA